MDIDKIEKLAAEEADKYCKEKNCGHICPNDWEIANDCIKIGYLKAIENIRIGLKELEMLSDAYITKIDYEYMSKYPDHNWDKESIKYSWVDLANAFEAGYRAIELQ